MLVARKCGVRVGGIWERIFMFHIAPCVWFDDNAEEAANFYATVFPNSRVEAVHRAPTDYPSGRSGQVLLVEFTLMD